MGTGIFPERGSGDGDGVNFHPVPIPIPVQGFIYVPIPIPIPIADRDLSPMRGGAPMGTGISRPIAIPIHGPATCICKLQQAKTGLEQPFEIKFNTTCFWVKAYDVPVMRQTKKFVEFLVSQVGTFVDYEDVSITWLRASALKSQHHNVESKLEEEKKLFLSFRNKGANKVRLKLNYKETSLTKEKGESNDNTKQNNPVNMLIDDTMAMFFVNARGRVGKVYLAGVQQGLWFSSPIIKESRTCKKDLQTAKESGLLLLAVEGDCLQLI
ncbi:hypothetical protein Cgig2_009225 [Carnegiea gigantea]|uniref:Uncharacterized protein n=1 Tax=Carnegiea gigantea TaxID=171969 RepID=A0A9Q1KA30_9CARY|nr:hypothetical protein Cgig2_009225 [Carnegiea gigantea]